jgi:hypothetical protein
LFVRTCGARMPIAWLVLVALTLTACGASAPTAVQVVTLPSGRHVKVLGVGKIAFSSGDTALMLKYETDVPLDDRARLSAEADDIWSSFRADVEKAGLSAGIVSANEHPTGGLITSNRGYNFVCTRGASGTWLRQ